MFGKTNKEKKRGVPRMPNPPQPPERNTTDAPKKQSWDVKSFDSPEAACLYLNATNTEPEFIYSNTSGKTVVWWKKPNN